MISNGKSKIFRCKSTTEEKPSFLVRGYVNKNKIMNGHLEEFLKNEEIRNTIQTIIELNHFKTGLPITYVKK